MWLPIIALIVILIFLSLIVALIFSFGVANNLFVLGLFSRCGTRVFLLYKWQQIFCDWSSYLSLCLQYRAYSNYEKLRNQSYTTKCLFSCSFWRGSVLLRGVITLSTFYVAGLCQRVDLSVTCLSKTISCIEIVWCCSWRFVFGWKSPQKPCLKYEAFQNASLSLLTWTHGCSCCC